MQTSTKIIQICPEGSPDREHYKDNGCEQDSSRNDASHFTLYRPRNLQRPFIHSIPQKCHHLPRQHFPCFPSTREFPTPDDHQFPCVMTVHLGLLFSFHLFPFSPLLYYTTDTFLSLLVIALSWTYLLTPRLGQDALRTVRLLPYLLHALSSLLLYPLRVHQYLLMCTLCVPFAPVPPHHCLMYHGTFCAHFLTP